MMNIQLYTTDLISGLEIGFFMEKINQHLDFLKTTKVIIWFSIVGIQIIGICKVDDGVKNNLEKYCKFFE